jgi:hypothetical protein
LALANGCCVAIIGELLSGGFQDRLEQNYSIEKILA